MSAPLVAHIIYRLDIGGLENGLVNLINHMLLAAIGLEPKGAAPQTAAPPQEAAA